MKIFITGATGFIGVHLCHKLVSLGHEIVALVRNPQKAQKLPQNNIEFIKGDLSLFKQEDLKLPKCDVIIHLAGQVFAKSAKAYEDINYTAVKDLIACLQKQDWKPQRLLFCSSVAAAGPTQYNVLKTENDPMNPNEPYGLAKCKAEKFLKAVSDFPITIFRPGAVYGPGDPAFLTVFKMAKKGWGFLVMGNNAQFSFVYVDDLVAAIVAMTQDTSDHNKTYFVNHNDIGDVKQMWQILKQTVNPKIKLIPLPRFLIFIFMCFATFFSKIFRFLNKLDKKEYTHMTTPAYITSSQSLQDDLEWRAHNTLQNCIEKTYQGYLKDGWL